MDINNSPLLPEAADVEESMFELEAAQWNYDQTLRALGRDLDNPLARADFENAREDLRDAQRALALAQAGLEARAQEFARLNGALGEGARGRGRRQQPREEVNAVHRRSVARSWRVTRDA